MTTFLERIRGRWPWANRATPDSAEAELADAGGPPTTLFGSAGVDEVLRIDIAWRAISVNAGSLAALRLRHVSLDDRGEEAAPIHGSRLQAILDEPSPGTLQADWLALISEQLDTEGEALVFIHRDRRARPRELEVLRSLESQAERIETPQGAVRWRLRTRRGRTPVTCDHGDVIHIRGAHWGRGALGAAARPGNFAAGIAARTHADAVARLRELSRSAALHARTSLRGEALSKLGEQYRRNERRDLRFLGAGIEAISSTGPQAGDKLLLDTAEFAGRQLATVYGVPLLLLGTGAAGSSALGAGGIHELAAAYERWTLRPRRLRIEAALEQRVLRNRRGAGMEGVRFEAPAPILTPTEKAQVTETLAAKAGILTRDEARARHGYPPLGGAAGSEVARPAGTPGPSPA